MATHIIGHPSPFFVRPYPQVPHLVPCPPLWRVPIIRARSHTGLPAPGRAGAAPSPSSWLASVRAETSRGSVRNAEFSAAPCNSCPHKDGTPGKNQIKSLDGGVSHFSIAREDKPERYIVAQSKSAIDQKRAQ